MNKIIKLAIVVILFAACSKVVKKDDLSIVGFNGEKAAYKVELAVTRNELATGLMNRESLDEKSGMLFDLRTANTPVSMWMKDTKISLDMIFIDKDGTVFWIYENAEPMSTMLIVPPYTPAAVLEVNAGDAKKFGINVGDVVRHKWFPSETKPFEPAIVETAEEETSVTEEAVQKE